MASGDLVEGARDIRSRALAGVTSFSGSSRGGSGATRDGRAGDRVCTRAAFCIEGESVAYGVLAPSLVEKSGGTRLVEVRGTGSRELGITKIKYPYPRTMDYHDSPEDLIPSPTPPGDFYEDIDYDNLSELLTLQLQDVDEFLKTASLPPSHHHHHHAYTEDSMGAPGEEYAAGKRGSENFILSSLRQMLSLNRKYQHLLREQLIMLSDGQKMTRGIQRWLRMMHVQLKRRKRHAGWGSCYAGASYLVDSQGSTPPENEESLRLKELLLEYGKAMRHPVRWTDKEKTALARGVRHLNQTILVDRLMAGLSLSALTDGGEELSHLEHDSIFASLAEAEASSSSSSASASRPRSSPALPDPVLQYQQAVTTVQRMPQRKLEMNLSGIDWTKIATLFVPTRSPEECRIQWTCNQHPLISHAPFTKDERARLMDIVKRRRGQSEVRGGWIEIAEELGSNRTAWQCLAAYRAEEEAQGSLGKSTAARKWTAEEDRILIEGVLMYGSTDAWSEISESLDGRTPAQCVHRWTKTLDPTKKTGRWSALEDAWLHAALRRVGSLNWALVQQFVPHRTDVQCRERYMNVLDPALLHRKFSAEEDRLLLRTVERYGEGKWSQVAEKLPGRTDNQCRRRWLFLQAEERKRKRPKPKVGRPRKQPMVDKPRKAPRRRGA